jgi:hypothetical protein
VTSITRGSNLTNQVTPGGPNVLKIFTPGPKVGITPGTSLTNQVTPGSNILQIDTPYSRGATGGPNILKIGTPGGNANTPGGKPSVRVKLSSIGTPGDATGGRFGGVNDLVSSRDGGMYGGICHENNRDGGWGTTKGILGTNQGVLGDSYTGVYVELTVEPHVEMIDEGDAHVQALRMWVERYVLF